MLLYAWVLNLVLLKDILEYVAIWPTVFFLEQLWGMAKYLFELISGYCWHYKPRVVLMGWAAGAKKGSLGVDT